MLALRLTTATTLLAIAASSPLSYHALTDEATGSVLIFPAARSAPPPMGDLRGIPMDVVKKEDTKGFLSSWWKPESRPVNYQPAPNYQHATNYQHSPNYQGHYDNYDHYYHNGGYPLSGYPNRYPVNRYPNKYPDKYNKWNELVDKFHGLYYDKQDKIHGLYYDKQDKLQGLYYDKYDKFGPHYHAHPAGYYDNDHYHHDGYHGAGWGVGGSHRYPNSDRPYEYGYEGGPYQG